MEIRGTVSDITSAFGQTTITISTKSRVEGIEKYLHADDVIDIKQHKEKRSLRANALLWACLGKIAKILTADPWEVYLMMLERYGKYVYVQVIPAAVDDLQRHWRETRIVGETDGMVDCLCYYGSSTYNSQEFSALLEGVISEMRQMGIEAPGDDVWKATIAEMEKREHEKKTDTDKGYSA